MKKYLKKTLPLDIYQNLGLECSAVILQVAAQTPLPAGPPSITGAWGRHPSPPHEGLPDCWRKTNLMDDERDRGQGRQAARSPLDQELIGPSRRPLILGPAASAGPAAGKPYGQKDQGGRRQPAAGRPSGEGRSRKR